MARMGILAMFTLAVGFVSSPASAFVKGDANCDGSIGAADVAAIAAAVGRPVGACDRVDVDGSGAVDRSDIDDEIGIVFPPFEEFVASESDFECLTDWARVRRFRIDNKLGRLDEALAVAHGDAPLPYPPGTIIQLVPNEAMVKRGGNFDLDNANWEYFTIDPRDGTTRITQRGREEVKAEVAPIACFACHNAARSFDFICETDNGCIQLGLSEELIDAIQRADPRCAAAP
jgi:hypothetical protein